MKFEWDEDKNLLNTQKHNIAFEEAITVFDSDTLTEADTRKDYGEERFITLGELKDPLGNFILSVVHTPRQGKTRIISARLASRKERAVYHEFIKRRKI